MVLSTVKADCRRVMVNEGLHVTQDRVRVLEERLKLRL